jgi:hypothetical protein
MGLDHNHVQWWKVLKVMKIRILKPHCYVYNWLAPSNVFVSVTEITDSVLVSRPVASKTHFKVTPGTETCFEISLFCYHDEDAKDILSDSNAWLSFENVR